MAQSIVIQVGQCGNQIGCQFWELALREYAHSISSSSYSAEASTECFFRKSDLLSPFHSMNMRSALPLKARAVLVDMEEGVVNNLIKGPISSVFDHKQLLTDCSGSGNNWAVGNKMYGSQYREEIVNLIRKEAEHCDCLQTFFLIHSLGGGTGSGLGTSILTALSEEFPEVQRFATSVFPSAEDDVITSPYNTVLACNKLTDYADCVFPVENQALLDISHEVAKALPRKSASGMSKVKVESPITSSAGSAFRKKDKPYDQMNNIVANLFLNLTSHARYSGSLNVDLNEIVTNLVPFPQLHYIVSSLTPLYALADVHIPPRRLDQMFSEAFSQHHHLLKTTPQNGIHLACALLVRGQVNISDVVRNVNRLGNNVKFIPWNQEGWKIGLCPVPPVGHPFSLLALSNNTCIQKTFAQMKTNFLKLYRRRAHLHHFLQVDDFESSMFEDALSSLTDLIAKYDLVTKSAYETRPLPPRLKS